LKRILLSLMISSWVLASGGLAFAQEPSPTAPDNSAMNARDRGGDTMTAQQQSNSKSDVELTREVRRAVVKDESLSTLAHNVKIVTSNGNVTLRGPVANEQEKTSIADKAQAIAGQGKVDNELEVKTQ
jgi:hyperosmotically inducible periplasmic protein